MGMEGPIQESNEKPETLGIKFFITDHSLWHPDQVMDEELYGQYGEMKRNGIDSIRFDCDWKDVMPAPDSINQEIIGRYINAIKTMKEVGLKPPTLVLSNPPEWIMDVYKKDREKFFGYYGQYLDMLTDALAENNLDADSVQLFNEINHPVMYRYVEAEDLQRISGIVRDALNKRGLNAKISTSIGVGNISDAIAKFKKDETTEEFLAKYETILRESFDRISFDYYPGVWHMPLKEAGYKLNDTFKQLSALKIALEKMNEWQKECEIGEVGFPTNVPYSTEDRQRYFYDSFFRAFRQLMVDFDERDVTKPTRVGLYEVRDEKNTNFGGMADKIMDTFSKVSRITPNPEYNFGLKNKYSEKKNILRARRDNEKDVVTSLHLLDREELSQLNRIINYVNRPIQRQTGND